MPSTSRAWRRSKAPGWWRGHGVRHGPVRAGQRAAGHLRRDGRAPPPILDIAKSGPATADAGTTATYAIALANSGGATAERPHGQRQRRRRRHGHGLGRPRLDLPGRSITVAATYAIPADQPAGPLADAAAVTWRDANGDLYGPVSSTFTTQVRPSQVTPVATISSGPVEGNFFFRGASATAFAAKPGDTPAFHRPSRPSTSTLRTEWSTTTFRASARPRGRSPTSPRTGRATFPAPSWPRATACRRAWARSPRSMPSSPARFVVAKAGDVTFNVLANDGFLLGVGGGATRVSGAYEQAPASNASPFQALSAGRRLEPAERRRGRHLSGDRPLPGRRDLPLRDRLLRLLRPAALADPGDRQVHRGHLGALRLRRLRGRPAAGRKHLPVPLEGIAGRHLPRRHLRRSTTPAPSVSTTTRTRRSSSTTSRSTSAPSISTSGATTSWCSRTASRSSRRRGTTTSTRPTRRRPAARAATSPRSTSPRPGSSPPTRTPSSSSTPRGSISPTASAATSRTPGSGSAAAAQRSTCRSPRREP